MKLSKALKGLWLMIFSVKIFDPAKKFKNKKVAVVGPADSAYEKENGAYIDEFDYVIRVNKAAQSWTEDKSNFIGKRTDILFHSFFENNESGGGPLNVELFKSLNIKYLISPRTNFPAYRRTFNFFKKYRNKITVYHLPGSFYKKMIIPFGKLRPTVGYTALYSALNSGCDSVYITGFTFFKTPYADGYRDHLQNMDKNLEHIRKQGIHDIELEHELFQKNVRTANCKHLLLDNKLEQIVTAYQS